MSPFMIAAEHIQKQYGGSLVLRDASIHVKQGEIYGLIGKNGSGKTTLLRILTGLVQGYGGKVAIGDRNNRRSKISAVINSPSLYLNLSAFENMKEQSYLLNIHDDNRIHRILKTIGLEGCGRKSVKNFSLGMKQRLKLGLALLENPDILILDEPVNGLDPDGIADLRQLLLHLNHTTGMTILISSHILSELEQIANCFGILHDGKIVVEVSNQDILEGQTTLEKIYMQSTRGKNSNVNRMEK